MGSPGLDSRFLPVVAMSALSLMTLVASSSQRNSTQVTSLRYNNSNDAIDPASNTSNIANENVTLNFENEIYYFTNLTLKVDWYSSILIYCIGFPGNILSFMVWIQKRMRHSSGYYLAALALDDFFFMLLHVVLELHVWGYHLLNTPVVCQLYPMLFLAAQYLGPLLVLGFTTERYISICHPFRREKYCTVRRAKMVIAILVGLALCLSSVQGYFYTMDKLGYNGTIECGPRPTVTVSSGDSKSFFILWNLSIEILTFLLVPLTVLILNIFVISEMRRLSRTEQVTLHRHSQRTSATTVMLLVVSFYLIITTLPVTIAYTLFYEFDTPDNDISDPLFLRKTIYLFVLTSIKEFGTTQYAFNIFFYIITGKMFRKELKRLFVMVLCGKISLSITKKYSSLRSSIRRDGSSKSKSMWVSVNGHTTVTTVGSTASKKPNEVTETNV